MSRIRPAANVVDGRHLKDVAKVSFFIVKTSDKSVADLLNKWFRGEMREEITDHFIRILGNGTYLTEPSGEILALVWSLRERSEGKVEVFVARPLREMDLPEKVRDAAKWLAEKPKSRQPLKEVTNLRVNCSIDLSEK